MKTFLIILTSFLIIFKLGEAQILSTHSDKHRQVVTETVMVSTFPVKIMPLGNSITVGNWIAGYRKFLKDSLNANGYNTDFVGGYTTNPGTLADKQHQGVGSATITRSAGTTYVHIENVRNYLTAHQPDIAIVELGTNDIVNLSAEQVRDNMSMFLDSMWAIKPNLKIVLVTIPPIDIARISTPKAWAARSITLHSYYNNIYQEKLIQGRPIKFANTYIQMDSTKHLEDGVHPSYDGWGEYAPGGYSIMNNTIYPQVKAFIDDYQDPLPVQLISFVGSYINNDSVKLEWQTISEINNYGFNVQRYNNISNNYETIGFVAGRGVPHAYSYIDESASSGVSGSLEYRLEQIDNNGLKSYFGPIMLNPNSVKNESVPAVFKLNQNYPNPFNPTTKIKYDLPVDAKVNLTIYNILGQSVAALVDVNQRAGLQSYELNAANLPGGVYFYRIEAASIADPNKSYTQVKKMVLMR